MPAFSIHRPVGPHFLDLSGCRCDDSMYDEASGPTVSVHRCEDGESYEEQIYGREYEEPYDPSEEEEGEFDHSHRQVDLAEIQEWIKSQYGIYMVDPAEKPVARESKVSLDQNEKALKKEPCSTVVHYGCQRAAISPAATWYSRKYVKSFIPARRNRGRKPREWWGRLAEERRGKTDLWA